MGAPGIAVESCRHPHLLLNDNEPRKGWSGWQGATSEHESRRNGGGQVATPEPSADPAWNTQSGSCVKMLLPRPPLTSAKNMRALRERGVGIRPAARERMVMVGIAKLPIQSDDLRRMLVQPRLKKKIYVDCGLDFRQEETYQVGKQTQAASLSWLLLPPARPETGTERSARLKQRGTSGAFLIGGKKRGRPGAISWRTRGLRHSTRTRSQQTSFWSRRTKAPKQNMGQGAPASHPQWCHRRPRGGNWWRRTSGHAVVVIENVGQRGWGAPMTSWFPGRDRINLAPDSKEAPRRL